MGRIRTVKPELFKHEDLYDLEHESGLPIRVAFMGLFTCCDREGRFKWRPRSLKADIMPYDDVDFSRVLHALSTRAFVVKYVIDGVEYGYIPTFCKHQVINHRESESVLPGPDESSIESITSKREARVDDASVTRHGHARGEGKGKEGKGREGKGKGKEGEKPMSGKPDECRAILAHLNAAAKREYQPVEANLSKIRARLNEGATPAQMIAVINRKVAEWINNPNMVQFLRPETLFNATKYAQYAGQVNAKAVHGERSAEGFLATFDEEYTREPMDDGMTFEMERGHA